MAANTPVADSRSLASAAQTCRLPGSNAPANLSRAPAPSSHASIAAKQPAETHVGHDLASRGQVAGTRRDQAVAESLVRAIGVVVLGVALRPTGWLVWVRLEPSTASERSWRRARAFRLTE